MDCVEQGLYKLSAALGARLFLKYAAGLDKEVHHGLGQVSLAFETLDPSGSSWSVAHSRLQVVRSPELQDPPRPPHQPPPRPHLQMAPKWLSNRGELLVSKWEGGNGPQTVIDWREASGPKSWAAVKELSYVPIIH